MAAAADARTVASPLTDRCGLALRLAPCVADLRVPETGLCVAHRRVLLERGSGLGWLRCTCARLQPPSVRQAFRRFGVRCLRRGGGLWRHVAYPALPPEACRTASCRDSGAEWAKRRVRAQHLLALRWCACQRSSLAYRRRPAGAEFLRLWVPAVGPRAPRWVNGPAFGLSTQLSATSPHA